MTENEIAKIVFDAAVNVHHVLGPGLLESAYEECLVYELRKKNNFFVEQQKPLPLVYEDVKLENGYRVDLLIDKKVIVELKAVEEICSIHKVQLLTYLKLSNCKLGLLINFNVEYIGLGFKRVINGIL